MDILDLLDSNGYYMTNSILIKKLGLSESVTIGYLSSIYRYAKRNNLLINGEYFYLTIDKMEEDLNLGKKAQNTILTKLEDMELISKKLIGLPAKRYFKINPNILEKLLTEQNDIVFLTRRETNLIAQACLEKDIPNSLEEPLRLFFLNYKRLVNKEITLYEIRTRLKKLINFENCTTKDLLDIINISTEKGWRNFYSNNFKNKLDSKPDKKTEDTIFDDTDELIGLRLNVNEDGLIEESIIYNKEV